MITSYHKQLAQQAMDFARKNGCQICRIGIYVSDQSSFDMRDLKMEQLSQASESRMQIELFFDGRYGAFSTNRMEKDELEQFIKNGINSVRYLEQDLFRQLPDTSLYYKGLEQSLQQFDQKIFDISPDEKKELLLKNIAEIFDTNDKIISISGNYSDGNDNSYLIASNGFEGETMATWFSLGVDVSLKGADDARPEEAWYESSIFYNDLKKNGIGRIALDRGLRKLGQKKVQSGKYPMIVENIISSRLLAPMLSALKGSALQQKNSFLLHQLNKKVGSGLMTIIDEPHIVKSFGARYFDEEGVATQRRPIFEDGILKTYYIDTYHALKMNEQQTVSSPSQLNMKRGHRTMNEIIQSQKKAILITGFNGGNCNPTTGDFSYGIEGFLIENGMMTQPVSEMNITGNMIDLWSHLMEVGNDPRIQSSRWIPTLLFDEVAFSGF